MAQELHTEDKLEYQFHPLTSGALHFQVKANNDAHVALTTGPGPSEPMYEIFLGGWQNQKSAVRKNGTKPDKAAAETPNLLSGDEFRKFWIRWDHGCISAGRDDNEIPFLSWTDPEPFTVGYYGVRTGWGASGKWIIEDGDEIVSDDSMDYSFFPITSGCLDMKIRCPHNAHVALTSGPEETTPMYEIFLGGWENGKCAIRYSREKPDKIQVDTPDIMCDGEFRNFCVNWKNGKLSVRRQEESDPFISWDDPSPFSITHFGVRTGWGAEGCWIVKAGDPGVVQPVRSACWVDATGGEIPQGAVVGGQDHDCEIYVGRVRHEGATVPGKVVPTHKVCYIPWGGEEHGKDEYQVLCGCEVQWVATSGGDIPEGALPAGKTQEGEPLFVGRVPHEGTITVGKVHPSHGVCYISYGGAELGFPDYEILLSTS